MKLIKDEFDKFLLLLLIVFFCVSTAILLIHFPNIDAATLQWIEKSSDMCLGALIGAVTTQSGKNVNRGTQIVEEKKDA